jgi:hypothetical protein
MRTLLPAVLLFVSVSGVAGEFSVTKSNSPGHVYKPPTRGLSIFNMRPGDYPRGAEGVSILKSIDWNTTMYPSALSEGAEICLVYFSQYDCKAIRPNSSGSTPFNARFRFTTMVMIRHSMKANVTNLNPAGQDMVKLNFSY